MCDGALRRGRSVGLVETGDRRTTRPALVAPPHGAPSGCRHRHGGIAPATRRAWPRASTRRRGRRASTFAEHPRAVAKHRRTVCSSGTGWRRVVARGPDGPRPGRVGDATELVALADRLGKGGSKRTSRSIGSAISTGVGARWPLEVRRCPGRGRPPRRRASSWNQPRGRLRREPRRQCEWRDLRRQVVASPSSSSAWRSPTSGVDQLRLPPRIIPRS